MDLPQFETIEGLPYPLIRGEEHPCSYLPGQTASELYLASRDIDSSSYQYLMDLGFRRSGSIFYKPDCKDCTACRPIRVKVSDFKMSKSQRKVIKKNQDLVVQCGSSKYSSEKYEIYEKYQRHQHDGAMSCSESEYQKLFHHDGIEGLEMTYFLNDKIVGVGLLDYCGMSLSSVYFYFDPEFSSRSLGVYSALMEIEECQKRNIPYWYIGYYIKNCSKMDYKARFKPNELLGDQGYWNKET